MNPAGATVALDVSMLPAPQPMERILDALDTLAPGAALQVLIHREPFPLYEILDRRGWRHVTKRRADARYDLLIARQPCSAH